MNSRIESDPRPKHRAGAEASGTHMGFDQVSCATEAWDPTTKKPLMEQTFSHAQQQPIQLPERCSAFSRLNKSRDDRAVPSSKTFSESFLRTNCQNGSFI